VTAGLPSEADARSEHADRLHRVNAAIRTQLLDLKFLSAMPQFPAMSWGGGHDAQGR